MSSRLARLVIACSTILAGAPACIPDWDPPGGMSCADDCSSSTSTSVDPASTGDPATPTTAQGDDATTSSDATTVESSESSDATSGTTDPPAELPLIVDGVVIPDYIDDNGVLAVAVTTMHAEGVRLLLDSGEMIELTAGRPGEFGGQIAAFTGLDNGKHTAVLTPWRDMLEGESVAVDYVIALPPPAYEIGWQADGVNGSVAAIAVLPDGRPVEFGTYQEMGAPRCYLRLRDKKGKPLEKVVPVLASAYCRAIDLKIDRDTGRMHVLVERESGDNTVWWAGELAAWGKGLKNIGIGAVGDTALALATRPDVVAVCGSRAVATKDKLDALAVLLRPDEPAEARTFDYWPGGDPKKTHEFTETARDCAFAGETLVLVGETRGRHDGEQFSRDRLTVIEAPLAALDDPAWTVAGLDQGVQTRALALDLDEEGHYHLAGYTCEDACAPVGEVRVHAPAGKLLDKSSLGPLGSPWFGPHDIAWSPAGYTVVALGEMQGQSFVFKVQAFTPGEPVPLWIFLPNDKQGAQLALALAVGSYGEVYAGGIGADDHPAFARIGS